MIEWWGPIIHEYYSATEGMGLAMCDSAEWLAHRGHGRPRRARRTACSRREMREVPTGKTGTLWFKTPAPFDYFNDPEKTAQANSPDRTMSTVGDIGYVDEDGFVYLTDRTAFMIISGGVNIYPQEMRERLDHPSRGRRRRGVRRSQRGDGRRGQGGRAADAGIAKPGPAMEAELIGFCREHLSHHKCPRSIDFEAELPRIADRQAVKGDRCATATGKTTRAASCDAARTERRHKAHGDTVERNAMTNGGAMGTEKVGRNDKCPCGSGRKYKQCCERVRPTPPAPSATRGPPNSPKQKDRLIGLFSAATDHAAAGRLGNAVHAFEEIARLESRTAEVHYNLGSVYLRSGRFAEAAASLQRAVDLRPSYKRALQNLAVALGRLGRRSEALKAYQKLSRTADDPVERRYFAAQACEISGNEREAESVIATWFGEGAQPRRFAGAARANVVAARRFPGS